MGFLLAIYDGDEIVFKQVFGSLADCGAPSSSPIPYHRASSSSPSAAWLLHDTAEPWSWVWHGLPDLVGRPHRRVSGAAVLAVGTAAWHPHRSKPDTR